MYLFTELESPILAATHKSSTAPGRVTALFHSVEYCQQNDCY